MKEQTDKNGAFNSERKRVNRNALISVLLAAVIIVTFFAGYFVRGTVELTANQKINEIIKIIDNSSIYAEGKTADELVADLVKEILKEDKYARYYTAEEYEKLILEDAGQYAGVGVGMSESTSGEVTIVSVYMNSPAYKSDVREGDVLIAGIFKGNTEYKTFEEYLTEYNDDVSDEKDKKDIAWVVNKFFSDYGIGEEIKFKVLRGDPATETEFALTKANYTVSYVEYKDNEKYFYFSTEEDGFKGRESSDIDKALPELSADTAYIRLCAFEGDATNQFAKAMEYMGTRGKTKLILDLRNNGGGLVNVMVDIASYLINDNGAKHINVVDLQEKSARTHIETSSNRFCSFLTDISVIANSGTASASESLIGALEDYGDPTGHGGANFSRSRLILTEENLKRHTYSTFGKSIMQTTYPLKSGGAIKLTTAYLFWPLTKIYIQDRGIETTYCINDGTEIAHADSLLHEEI